MDEAALCAKGLWKAFGPVHALKDVSLELRPGEIHAILGENGAGKSTLMNVLAGFISPDQGSLTFGSEPVPFGQPAKIKSLGIEMVHQHFMLVPEFSVAENLALGQLRSLGGSLDLKSSIETPLRLARELGWTIDPNAKTRGLPVGMQQRVEILKALSAEGSVLILDEPTAVLSAEEVEDLFRVLRKLRDRGQAIALIAHKLSEVMEIADWVTVLRHGRKVASASMQGISEQQLAHWMVGDQPQAMPAEAPVRGAEALEVQDLAVRGDRGEQAVQGVSFTLNRGEILGFGGVDGNGQIELAEMLARVRSPDAGQLLWNGKPLDPPVQIAYIPQDRQSDGLALSMSILDNLLIKGVEEQELWSGPFARPGRIRRWAERLVKKFRIKVGSPREPASSLSGGNQQKVVVSRNLASTPDLLVAVNPTRGLDLLATEFVHEQTREAARNGSAVALFSSDRDELAALAHRTLILSGGKLEPARHAEPAT